MRSETGAARMVEALTQREVQILESLDSDLNNKELARALCVTEGTLKWHLQNIYGKLGVRNRFGAMKHAKRQALGAR